MSVMPSGMSQVQVKMLRPGGMLGPAAPVS
jgi:hypothetical protein